jgi:hypothetical protein
LLNNLPKGMANDMTIDRIDCIEKEDPPMENKRKELGLPILALSLDLAAILLFYLSMFLYDIAGVLFLFSMLFPIVAVINGVNALRKGKARIGMAGKIIAIIAIAIPLLVVLYVIMFFVGVATGIVSLM